MTVSPPELLAVGRVARAHGVRGRVLIAPFNAESTGLERASALWLSPKGQPGQQRRYDVAHAERANLGYLVTLKGIAGRDAADALRGSEVLVDRAELPGLDEGEVWAADLVGCSAVDTTGALCGTVTGLEDAGPNELLTLELPSGAVVLVPLGLVREVDPATKRIVIEVPEGLFEVQQAPAKLSEEDAALAAAGAAEGSEESEVAAVNGHAPHSR